MLTETAVTDSINVKPLGQIEVRVANRVLRDGVEIAKTYQRHVLNPGDDLSGQDARVIAVAQAAWTPDVIAAYQQSVAAAVELLAALQAAIATQGSA